MTAQPRTYSVRDFEAFTELPENQDRLFEYINGEIVEKVPNNALASKIAVWIAHLILVFLKESGIKGHVTGEAGGFMIGIDRYAPDVAYLSKEKQNKLEGKGCNSIPPDLVVEVETNTTTETERRLRHKIHNYVRNGIVVWVVYPETQEIEIYTPDDASRKLNINDTLEGGDVLPGFKAALKDIFAD